MNRHLLEFDFIAHVSAHLDKHKAILRGLQESPLRTLSLNPAEGPEMDLARQRDVIANLERLLEKLSNPAS